MEPTVAEAVAACRQSHQRLASTVAALDDDTARRPSRLPNWTVGHVLTHLARNADGHRRRLDGALLGREVPRYPGGPPERDSQIEEGAGRTAGELVDDVTTSARRLDETYARAQEAGWPHADLLAADPWPTTQSPLRRLREVEMHHVDLGLGYEPADWPDLYLDWELPTVLSTLPDRLSDAGASRQLLAWLTGRADSMGDLRPGPWV